MGGFCTIKFCVKKSFVFGVAVVFFTNLLVLIIGLALIFPGKFPHGDVTFGATPISNLGSPLLTDAPENHKNYFYFIPTGENGGCNGLISYEFRCIVLTGDIHGVCASMEYPPNVTTNSSAMLIFPYCCVDADIHPLYFVVESNAVSVYEVIVTKNYEVYGDCLQQEEQKHALLIIVVVMGGVVTSLIYIMIVLILKRYLKKNAPPNLEDYTYENLLETELDSNQNIQ